ncbi:hypothetical protein HDV00_008786 [Rhizophlyctis rosea]|nr:hypothetical protein HDV00_008786 [Rhizophlyctis rosea]
MVQLLLDAGADIHINKDDALVNGAEGGHSEVVAFLLRAGADIHTQEDRPLRVAATSGSTCIVQVLLAAGSNSPPALTRALAGAAGNDHAKSIKVLVDAGADPFSGAEHYNWANSARLRPFDAIQALLEAGAYPNGTALVSVMCFAAASGNLLIVSLLLSTSDKEDPHFTWAIDAA